MITARRFESADAEGNPETRLNLRGRGYLYIYCNKHGLMKMKV